MFNLFKFVKRLNQEHIELVNLKIDKVEEICSSCDESDCSFYAPFKKSKKNYQVLLLTGLGGTNRDYKKNLKSNVYLIADNIFQNCPKDMFYDYKDK